MGDATGLSQKNAFINMLKHWEVKDDVFDLLMFDTTASNTGLCNGCAVLIEKEVNCSLLWLACHHHVYEVHMENSWQDLPGKTVRPDEILFKWFQSNWKSFSHDLNDLQLFDWLIDDTSNIWQTTSEVIRWGEECIDQDYRELLELTGFSWGQILKADLDFSFGSQGLYVTLDLWGKWSISWKFLCCLNAYNWNILNVPK